MRITYPDSGNLSGCAHTLRIPPRGMRRQGQDTHARPIGGRRGACGARPRCRWVAAGPGQAHAHQATPDWRPSRSLRGQAAVPEGGGRARASTRTPGHAQLEAVAEPAGPGRGAGGRRQGLAGLRDDAPGHTPAARRRRCGGRRRDRRARAGFEIDHSEPLGSRVAISRAAGASGAWNTSGATSNAGDQAGPQPQQAAPRAAAAQ